MAKGTAQFSLIGKKTESRKSTETSAATVGSIRMSPRISAFLRLEGLGRIDTDYRQTVRTRRYR
jgi:hypothetical protein